MTAQIGKLSTEVFRSLTAPGANVGKLSVEVIRSTEALGANIGKLSTEVLRSTTQIQDPTGARLRMWTGSEWIIIS